LFGRPGAVFTTSLYRATISRYRLHAGGPIIVVMDILAVALGIASFAILLGLIFAIDRI
jgi:hypothetical protein